MVKPACRDLHLEKKSLGYERASCDQRASDKPKGTAYAVPDERKRSELHRVKDKSMCTVEDVTCVECGNDISVEGYDKCLDCLEFRA